MSEIDANPQESVDENGLPLTGWTSQKTKDHIAQRGCVRVTLTAAKDALIKARGNVSVAASFVPCHPVTLYDKMRKYPQLRELKEEIIRSVVDEVENVLVDNALNPTHLHASERMFYLRAHNDKYTNKVRNEHSGTIQHTHKADAEQVSSILDAVEALAQAKHDALSLPTDTDDDYVEAEVVENDAK